MNQTEMFETETEEVALPVSAQSSKKDSPKPRKSSGSSKKRKVSAQTKESTRKFWGLKNKKTRKLLREFEIMGVRASAVFNTRQEARHWRDVLNDSTRKNFIIAPLD